MVFVPRKFSCPLCRWEGHPSFELVDDPGSPLGGKLAAKCGKIGCSYTDPSLTPASFNEGIAVDSKGVATVVSTVANEVVSRSPVAQRQWTEPRQSQRRDDEQVDVIALMRRRRDYLEMEVARLDAAKIELRKLNKMISVADREQAKIDAERATHSIMTTGGDAE